MTCSVKIWTSVPELLSVPECVPIPASKALPNWWSTMPSVTKKPENLFEQLTGMLTAKRCPSFPDFLTQGVVIPMWADTYLRVDQQEWGYSTARAPSMGWSRHDDAQFLNHIPSWAKENISATLKAESPWHIKTPKGYSVFQMPLFYNFETNYTVMPGSIQTDVHHQVNPQVLIHSKEKEIFIARGTPFIWLIPYKRENFDLEIISTDKGLEYSRVADFHFLSKFRGGYKAHAGPTCPMRQMRNSNAFINK